mgnify:CR=1 FL=1
MFRRQAWQAVETIVDSRDATLEAQGKVYAVSWQELATPHGHGRPLTDYLSKAPRQVATSLGFVAPSNNRNGINIAPATRILTA